ncbi:MAG: hypothetical protein F4Z31_06665 [Gemmatimonadetes bacterium]|nr:hypothetical protein [Gemmatimonadota bacterium]MCY3678577.1 hypothetical protein [Gemmatimonadota bacterium]MYA41418.1 hypothetical protein [Gemmatimonadota bacterium]MYE95495.1 hypothetical protein [Gemmatimonadota bacterium]MYJ11108.1 hypothetical protein [Gemmatimonadota bacterium]
MTGVLGVETGLLVVANPLNCGLTGADWNRINKLHRDGRGDVIVAFVAAEHDTAAATAMIQNMNVLMPHVVIGIQQYLDLAGPLRPRLPAFIAVKQGRPVMTLGNMEPGLALDLVGTLSGTIPNAREYSRQGG